jgi:hypothetical protein
MFSIAAAISMCANRGRRYSCLGFIRRGRSGRLLIMITWLSGVLIAGFSLISRLRPFGFIINIGV